jgi:nicotinamidase-related amidase
MDEPVSFRNGDALLAVDIFNDFDHEDGDRLLDSFRERAPDMRLAIEAARAAGVHVVFANDARGWQDDAPRVVHEAGRAESWSRRSSRTPASRCC